jgi:hypothetical protein
VAGERRSALMVVARPRSRAAGLAMVTVVNAQWRRRSLEHNHELARQRAQVSPRELVFGLGVCREATKQSIDRSIDRSFARLLVPSLGRSIDRAPLGDAR